MKKYYLMLLASIFAITTKAEYILENFLESYIGNVIEQFLQESNVGLEQKDYLKKVCKELVESKYKIIDQNGVVKYDRRQIGDAIRTRIIQNIKTTVQEFARTKVNARYDLTQDEGDTIVLAAAKRLEACINSELHASTPNRIGTVKKCMESYATLQQYTNAAVQEEINKLRTPYYQMPTPSAPPINSIQYQPAQKQQEATEPECCVCYTKTNISKLPCSHWIHTECALKWKEQKNKDGRYFSCPMCRREYTGPEIRAALGLPEPQPTQDHWLIILLKAIFG